ncbi:MAG: ABC transporter permease subunit [Acidothermales bacterium]|jgi:putative spermidine/putrescine transport system permease protein|nr:ABC transporter permease subunit [Acidothermales bacterium]
MKRIVGVGVLVLGVLAPIVPLFVWAVSARWRYPALVPQEPSLRGLRLIVDPQTAAVRGVATSLAIAVAVTILASLIGLPAGRALGLHAFRGKRVIQLLLLAPALVPTLAVSLGMHVTFIRYGLADTVPGVVLAQLVPTIPYVTFVMASAFANFDGGYEQQARTLGAGSIRTLVSVTIPAVRPALVVAAYFAFLISWSEYVLTLVIGGGVVQTLPLLVFGYIQSADLTLAAALSLLFVLPPLLLVGLTSRYLTGQSGVALGFGRA